MSESKKRVVAVSLGLFLIGTIIALLPWFHKLWVNYTMHRDVQAFLSYVEVSTYVPGQKPSHEVIEEDGEAEEVILPTEHTQLWLDMQSYNQTIFQESQTGLSDPAAYEEAGFRLTDYGLESEVFGVLSIPRLELDMPIYSKAKCKNHIHPDRHR